MDHLKGGVTRHLNPPHGRVSPSLHADVCSEPKDPVNHMWAARDLEDFQTEQVRLDIVARWGRHSRNWESPASAAG